MLRDLHEDGTNKTDAESAEHIAAARGVNLPIKVQPANLETALEVPVPKLDINQFDHYFGMGKGELKDLVKDAGMKVTARTTAAQMIQFLIKREIG